MDLRLSSAYHPQTERVNQTMEQYLCCLLATLTSSWVKALTVAEFAYNSLHSSLGMLPFFCAMGLHPRTVPMQPTFRVPAVDSLCTKLKEIWKVAQTQLQLTKEKVKLPADKHRRLAPCSALGDKVWLA